jgi:hypothetical protein
MEIVLTRTGDPWMDWGLVALYDFLRTQRKRFVRVSLDAGRLVVETREEVPVEEYASLLYTHLKERINDLILPAPEMKALGLEFRVQGKNGFFNPAHTVTLSPQQKTELKDKLNSISASPGVTLRRNYVGLKKDWEKLAEELGDAVDHFFSQQQDKGRSGHCQLCGRPAAKKTSCAMRQNKNPFYNQHHNNRVRGHANSVTTLDMCPTCNLLNIFAAVQSNTPYFIDSGRTHIILPRVDDLAILHKIFSNIKSRLVDLLGAGVISYATNITGLRRHNLYQAITGVYFNIVHRYVPEMDEYREDPLVKEYERRAVRRWVILRFSKGQNVSFAHFNHLDVDPRLFELVRGMEYGVQRDKYGNVYTTFFGGVSCREPRVLNELARGIVQADWPVVAKSLLAIQKETRRSGNRVWVAANAISFFEQFVQYALTEVDRLLDKQLAEDIKVLGRTLGANFSSDIALFTSLNNAPGAAAFRHVLREAFFKMYKLGVSSTKKGGQQLKLLVPGEKRVENILNSVTEENIEAVKDTLLIYAVLSALRPRGEAKDKQDENVHVEVQ